MTQATDFIASISARATAVNRNDIEAAGATRTGRFEENQFFAMPDGSRIILSDPVRGFRQVRAAPAID